MRQTKVEKMMVIGVAAPIMAIHSVLSFLLTGLGFLLYLGSPNAWNTSGSPFVFVSPLVWWLLSTGSIGTALLLIPRAPKSPNLEIPEPQSSKAGTGIEVLGALLVIIYFICVAWGPLAALNYDGSPAVGVFLIRIPVFFVVALAPRLLGGAIDEIRGVKPVD
jgi:hypothetical protein